MTLMEHKKDPATEQTASGYPEVKAMGSSFKFTPKEIEVLRRLAAEVAEIAQRPEMKKKAELWTAHNDLKTDEPVVFIDLENGWNECIPADTLEYTDPMARVWEMNLRKQIFWADKMKDDKVVEPYLDVPYSYFDTGWGVELKKDGGENGGSYIIRPAIEDYETDFEKLHHPEYQIDWEESNRLMELAHEVFDGILHVRRKNTWWWTLGLCFDYVNIRGMENFMCDFAIEPEWVEKTLDLICEGKLKMLDYLEENHLLAQNTGGTYVGSGGFGFTNEIPTIPEGAPVTTRDMWGFCDSQETVSINPDWYGEFILPRHKRILERFALNCYGCCEPYHVRWKYVKQLPNLRRVSVSPWADWSTVPEYLGKNYIASVKPMPTQLASYHMNEDVVRADCRRAVEQTKGGICEFIMKDNNTLGNNPNNAIRWVEIMREEIDRVYK
ncbi:MAG: hypothetical protein ACOX8H_00805 [Ruminococcus sp.]|jgi:hypothetical protein